MKINITSVKKEIGSRQPFIFLCDITRLFNENEQQWTSGQVAINGFIVNNGKLLEIEGTIHVKALLSCGRCLEQFEAEFEIPFHELLKEDMSADHQQDDFIVFQGDEIDISDLVRETIVLSEPLRTVCSEECKGLCPSCGINLNIASCGCAKDSIDPRLAALKKLLEKD